MCARSWTFYGIMSLHSGASSFRIGGRIRFYSRLLLLTFAMAGIGRGHTRMITTASIGRSVISTCKCGPVFGLEMLYQSGIRDEICKHVELISFGTRHKLHKVLQALGSTPFPIETSYLEHPPECALDSSLRMNGLGCLKAAVGTQLRSTVGIEHHGMRFTIL